MIDLISPRAAGHHCLHPSFSLSLSLTHCLPTLPRKVPSHFALPAGHHILLSQSAFGEGRQQHLQPTMQIMAGAKKITITVHPRPARSTKSCLQSVSQFVSVLFCAATSPQFSGSSAASHLEPAPFLLLGDRWHKGAAPSEVKSNEVERAGLGREQGAVPCCPLILSLLPSAEEALINARKATNTST